MSSRRMKSRRRPRAYKSFRKSAARAKARRLKVMKRNFPAARTSVLIPMRFNIPIKFAQGATTTAFGLGRFAESGFLS